MPNRILYLNGKPQAGKDTVAGMLTQRIQNSVIDRFATPIRTAVTGLVGTYIDTHEFKSQPIMPPHKMTVREFMIGFSENFVKQNLALTAFAQALTIRANHLFVYCDTLIIPDCGFSYEVAYVCKAFPETTHQVIRIVRPDSPQIADSREILQMPHFTIMNDGTLDDLHARVRALITEL